MSQISRFQSPRDLLEKAKRECNRINSAKTHEDFADGVFNFCVTCHSLRDWVKKTVNLKGKDAEDFGSKCNSYDYLKYCKDIANGIKHLGLDYGDSSVALVDKTEDNYVYIDATGRAVGREKNASPSGKIVLDDGSDILVITFTLTVLRNWESIFKEYGVK